MAKIAALILPARRASDIQALSDKLATGLRLHEQQHVDSCVYRHERAVCALLRQGPDAINPTAQPLAIGGSATVSCGYYRAAADDGAASGESVERIHRTIDTSGPDGLAGGDGVYAYAFWDGQQGRLLAGVDKLGMRPLYWLSVPGGGYAIASEIKALVGLAGDLETNWSAWEEQLTFGFVFGDHTFFNGIRRFGVAECMRFQNDRHAGTQTERFLESIDVVDRPLESFLEEQHAVFDTAMARLAAFYDAERDTMLTLSGGFDSRRILGWLLNKGIRPTAYTVPEVFADGSEYESAIVREICQRVGISGYSVYPATVADRIQVNALRDLATDFESDEHCFSTILAMGLGCRGKVNYDGLAAGSQLSGSFVTRAHFEPGGTQRFLSELPRSVRHWLTFPRSQAPALEQRVRTQLQRWGDNPNRFAYFYLLSRTRREVALAPLSIQANVFESLCPFLDRGMMRSALSFPPARKVGADIQWQLIGRLHPALAQIPTVYSPTVSRDPRYLVDMGKLEHQARRHALKRAFQHGRRDQPWSGGLRQQLRFQAARLAALLGSNPRLRWEFAKAAKLGQLAHFEQLAHTPDYYALQVQALQTAFAQRPHWCRPL